MARDGVIRLDLRDVYGERLGERVDINLRNMMVDHQVVVRGASASRLLRVEDLHAVPDGLYRVVIDPPSYLPVGVFITARSEPETTSLVFPVDPGKVTGALFRPFAELFDDLRRVLDETPGLPGLTGLHGEALYEGLDDIRRAGLLNVSHKAAAAMLAGGRPVFSYLRSLAEVRGDRVFARADGDLVPALDSSFVAGLVDQVSGALHELPASIPNFDDFFEVGSYKTADSYGNLQVTVFRNGTDFIADIDIDDANGLGHVFQVLRNHLTGRPTHPYDIHEILMAHQSLDPGYVLQVA